MIAREQLLAVARSRLAQRLRDRNICVCAGAGGVGKTTISAALALGLALAGKRVVVVTIDPARRLATALGLEELGGEPRPIEIGTLAASGDEPTGELWAMMLDPKETFDELIGRLAPDEQARDEVLSNHIYRQLSSAVAGSQEFTAIAKLYELHKQGRFDMIMLDTPPTRETLDFLSAPARISRFLEGRALRAFLAPSGGLAARLLGRGTGILFGTFARVTGIDLMTDLATFFGALAGLLDGFHERVLAVEEVLRDPATAFLIVTTPESVPAREAIAFASELERSGLARAALIVNRIHSERLQVPEQQAHALLAAPLGDALAGRLTRNLIDYDLLASRDRATVAALEEALEDPAPILVSQLDGEVQDLAGLARIAMRLFV